MRRVFTILDLVLEGFVLTPPGEHSDLDVALFVDVRLIKRRHQDVVLLTDLLKLPLVVILLCGSLSCTRCFRLRKHCRRFDWR